MGLKYGLLAALTLVLASALVWDRLHPPRDAGHGAPLPAPGDTVRVLVGGDPLPEPPPPSPEPGPAHSPDGRPSPTGPGSPPRPDAREPEPEPAARETTYTVAPGDTLGAIALRTLGTSRRAADLARHNGMDPDSVLRVGTVLRIPGTGDAPAVSPAAAPRGRERPEAAPRAERPAPPVPAARSHLVARGDTLYSISRRYYGDGGRWRSIATANGLGEGDALSVGKRLVIP